MHLSDQTACLCRVLLGWLHTISQHLNTTETKILVQTGGPGEGFEVQKYGDGRVALIGFPSVGAAPCLNVIEMCVKVPV